MKRELEQEPQEDQEKKQKVEEDMNSLRLKLGNLGKHVYKKDVQKILTQKQLKFKNVKVAPKWTWAIISFESKEDLDICVKELDQFEFKGNSTFLSILKSEPTRQPKPAVFVDDGRTPSERIQDQVTPLWRVPYEDQLTQKQESVRKVASRLKNELWRYFPKKNYQGTVPDVDPNVDPLERIKGMSSEQRALEQLEWIRSAAVEHDGIPCPLLPIVPSPITKEYRTKCEFTFGKDLEGEKTCGFLLGLYKEGQTAILNPRDCLNVSKNGKTIADFLQDYARKSKYDVYDRTEQKGFFRLALVRTLQSGQCMIMLQINPTDISKEDLELEKEFFKKCILEHVTNDFTINSLYWQESTEKFNGIKDDMPMELLHGTPQVVEHLLGLKFEISPTSFFQVNPPATELLYGKIRDLSLEAAKTAKESVGEQVEGDEEPGVVLLDLCSGTGTIGISMAQHVKKVIGVELCAEAVEDAKRNTTLNGLENVFSLQGKVEEKMHGIFTYHIKPQDTVIAVLDPPRAGVHYSVIKSIRDCASLKHVVFVACDFNNSLQNIIDLCRPTSNKYKGHPFVPKQIIPVDMFPHTPHCEVIVELIRQEPKVAPVEVKLDQ